ncbi:MAG: DM13 domain-containing protein [Anaerolineales bacterium]
MADSLGTDTAADLSHGKGALAPPVPGGPPAAPGRPPSPARLAVIWLSLLALVASALVASNTLSVRDRLFGTATPDPAPAAASRDAGMSTPESIPERTALRSQPWWQNVTTLEGTGPAISASFTIDKSALQWRVKWSCQSGRLLVRAPRQAKPLVDATCPEGAPGYSVQNGPASVEVTADGAWRLEVSQQIDAPLVEPPLPAMSASGASALATGPFYNVDRTATGTVTVYRHGDGRFSLRLEDFFVSPTADLELRLSPLEAPRTSAEFMNAGSEFVAVMDVTAGSLNYAVPAGIDPRKFRSVVIWCAPIRSAYGAASLGAPR